MNIPEIQPQNSGAHSVLIQPSLLKKKTRILQAVKDCHLQIGRGKVRVVTMFIALLTMKVDKS